MSRIGSNAFANGASMNSGNYLVDGRPTSRVNAPPGGQSSFSLAWDSPAKKVPAPVDVAAPPAGAPRESPRTASKAKPPPASSISLAWDSPVKSSEAPAAPPAAEGGSANGPTVAPPVAPAAAAPVAEIAPPAAEVAPPAAAAPIPSSGGGGYAFGGNTRHGSNAFANGATPEVGNFITDRSTTRLHAPPGGHSTIQLW